ncbi:MAG: formylglycine-generating enzyme family protein [Armatimonadetes bacterium]|nr:formylglycine-generating enzyme family protein [Armatimonadota bacterium]
MGGHSCAFLLLCALSVNRQASPPGPNQAFTSAPEVGDVATITLPGGEPLRLVWVPPAVFRMGSTDGPDERPPHAVSLDGFWMGATEVTVAQWRAVMGEAPARNSQGDQHPVLDVSWEECHTFCARAGLALPTEAQWEYAARGPDSRLYPWGNDWNAALCQSWHDRHGYKRSLPVGSLPAGRSWCGALDMSGNVFEWCRDWYDSQFYASPAAAQRNAECVTSLSGRRLLRGGCWGSSPDNCRATVRCSAKPDFHNAGVGFRASRPG